MDLNPLLSDMLGLISSDRVIRQSDFPVYWVAWWLILCFCVHFITFTKWLMRWTLIRQSGIQSILYVCMVVSGRVSGKKCSHNPHKSPSLHIFSWHWNCQYTSCMTRRQKCISFWNVMYYKKNCTFCDENSYIIESVLGYWEHVQNCILFIFLSASLYVSKRGAYWDKLCRDVVGRWLVGWLSRACTVAKRCILGL